MAIFTGKWQLYKNLKRMRKWVIPVCGVRTCKEERAGSGNWLFDHIFEQLLLLDGDSIF